MGGVSAPGKVVPGGCRRWPVGGDGRAWLKRVGGGRINRSGGGGGGDGWSWVNFRRPKGVDE
jgi:hypothetical protein